MAKLRALTAFSLGGGRDVFPGDIFEVPEPFAGIKVRNQVAAYADPGAELKRFPDPAVAKPHPEAGREAVKRDPAPTHGEARPAMTTETLKESPARVAEGKDSKKS